MTVCYSFDGLLLPSNAKRLNYSRCICFLYLLQISKKHYTTIDKSIWDYINQLIKKWWLMIIKSPYKIVWPFNHVIIMSRRKQAKPIRHLEDGTIINLNGKNNKPYFILKKLGQFCPLFLPHLSIWNWTYKVFFQKFIPICSQKIMFIS